MTLINVRTTKLYMQIIGVGTRFFFFFFNTTVQLRTRNFGRHFHVN
jgi:hypothetical protein